VKNFPGQKKQSRLCRNHQVRFELFPLKRAAVRFFQFIQQTVQGLFEVRERQRGWRTGNRIGDRDGAAG
jgi:hypothetical protein